jgi:catechol 2,3-dioxygenase-like lactoylglutathione lyase family enzyme
MSLGCRRGLPVRNSHGQRRTRTQRDVYDRPDDERGDVVDKSAKTSEGTAETDAAARDWPGAIGAITLFVEDLAETSRFYRDVFGLPVFFEDDDSTVFRFGETLVNLLRSSEAHELVTPAAVAAPDGGVRFQLTLGVYDVDATCEELRARGVELLNGPVDRPWGIRTASFRDPAGHVWEIAR